ncbi:MAG: membrane protein insertase YidC [Chloroflexi bacterium]|nr:membrane protein insertase YidC [Chloroflexota bacterium]MBI4314878.1 membrane protein insertase YidC [Chloroflexota bacterium]MBI5290395.1 membrane protein insertase YidC [Chloroflexota bacterium]
MWNSLIIYPFTNALLLLYSLVGQNFTWAIIIFTILIRLLTVPLTISSQRNQARMAEMQPKLKELQEKYKDQPEKLNAEMAALGYGPGQMLGGCLPMLIQFPLLIGLYQSITYAMAVTPLSLLDLYHAIYPFFPNFAGLVPVNNHFLWLNLALPDPIYVLPVLVAATTWLQQAVMTPAAQPGGDAKSAQMTKSMGMSMTIMFAFMSLQFASGLSIYFVVSNLIGLVQYGFIDSKSRARTLAMLRLGPQPVAPAPALKSGKAGRKSGKSARAGAKK